MKKELVLCIALIQILAGCATEYRKKDETGGYSEIQLAEDTWRVRFDYSRFTQKEQIVDFPLLRSAELTLQSGYSYFSISDTPASSRGSDSNKAGPALLSREVKVKMFSLPPLGEVAHYDAKAVCDRLGNWYQERCR